MNTTKEKTWASSMFAQFSNIENNNNVSKRKKINEDPKSSQRAAKRNIGAPIFGEKTIDLDCCNHFTNKSEAENLKEIKFAPKMMNNNWIDIFTPRSSEELATHPKKRQDLEQWFKHCAFMKQKPGQLCLLTGPSGCGKTTAVQVLAKENNISIQEWINPVDQDNIYNLGDQKHVYCNSQIDAFKNFLFKASRYRSLLEINMSNKCLLIVEDFPNFILKDPSVFHEILEDYIIYAKSPLIFIVTDAKTRSINISYNIFTDQIKQRFKINHISFNPIASTIMQKSMKRFCNLMRSPPYWEHYKPPHQDILDSIIFSAQGDIRNALINLHFSSLKGAPNLLTKLLRNEKIETKISRKKKYGSKLKSVGCDESLTMMHALGRVFNPKFTDEKRFVHSPEELAVAFSTEPKKFIDLVQANYLQHFNDICYVLEAADGLSLCDIMLNEYRDDSLGLVGLNVGIRHVMVANTNPATGWIPIKGQRRFDLSKAKLLPQGSKLLPEHHNISSSLYKLDYNTFVNIIES